MQKIKRMAGLVVLVMAMAMTAQAQTETVRVEWEYTPDVTEVPTGTGGTVTVTNWPDVFVLKATNNLAAPNLGLAPLASWPTVQTIPALSTNAGKVTVTLSALVPVEAGGKQFFTMVASNMWGQSDFFGVALKNSPPAAGRIAVKRGP